MRTAATLNKTEGENMTQSKRENMTQSKADPKINVCDLGRDHALLEIERLRGLLRGCESERVEHWRGTAGERQQTINEMGFEIEDLQRENVGLKAEISSPKRDDNRWFDLGNALDNARADAACLRETLKETCDSHEKLEKEIRERGMPSAERVARYAKMFIAFTEGNWLAIKGLVIDALEEESCSESTQH